MTDVQVGDLVRATRKADPETKIEGRVSHVFQNLFPQTIVLPFYTINSGAWDIEILHRPAPPTPPIDEELLVGAIEEFRRAQFGRSRRPWFEVGAEERGRYRTAFAAVINFVREYDKNKESK